MESSFTLKAGDELQQSTLGFPAFGAIIENITNQWYYEPNRRRFIPPYQSGATIPLVGVTTATLRCAAPGVQVQAAPIAGEYCTVSYVDSFIVAGSGVNARDSLNTLGPPARLAPEDRNATPGFLFSAAQVAGPSSANLGQIIASPTTKKAKVEYVELTIIRAAAAAPVSFASIWIQLAGGPPTKIGAASLFSRNTVGDTDRVLIPTFTLLPGQSVDVVYQDFGTGGAIYYEVASKWLNYDP